MSSIPNYIQSSSSTIDHDPDYLGPNLKENDKEDVIPTSFPVPKIQPKNPVQQPKETSGFKLPNYQQLVQQAQPTIYVMPRPEDENLDMTSPEDDYAEFNLMNDISHYMHNMRHRMT